MIVWVRQWLDVDRRLQHGHYHRLMYELRYKDTVSYFNFIRVPPDRFDDLLGRLRPVIAKQDTPYVQMFRDDLSAVFENSKLTDKWMET